MSKSESRKPAEILKDILHALQSAEPEARLNGIAQLHTTNYSSEAIRGELEKLALRDPNEEVRAEALAALNLATQRNVRSQINKIKLGERHVLLQEIKDWEKLGLLEKERAEVIRRRYDFDVALPTSPKVDSVKPIVSTPEKIPAPVAPPQPKPQPKPATVAPAQTFKPAPVAPPKPAAPRLTLTQILLSENSIKVALYLGAFFVIASAAILAALYEVARLPILVIATLIFGGFSVAIRKRLPQPSFAIFVVFSFLLPITANVLKESLNLSSLPFNAAYWVFVSAFMALIWMGGARLYESRLFSVTALASFTVALYRVGDMFYAASEFYATMLGLAALTGLLGVWALKQWKNANFARPLFFAAQLLQVAALVASIGVFFIQFIGSASTPLWNLASVFTWGFAFLFYAISDLLFPFIFFPWLAAGTLFVMPWFVGAAFKMDALGGTISFLVWGLILSAASELTYRLEKIRKYSLPVLLVSVGIFAVTVTYGFTDQVATGFISALVVAVAYAALHFIRPRGWLWAISLFNFIVAYFAFFSLPFMEKIHVFFGYELLGVSLIFLLPDLLLKNDLKDNWAWRLPPRIYGAFFTILSFIIYPITQEVPLINTAVMFGVYALFFAVYAMRYDKAIIGYIAALSLVISAVYALNYFEWNIVLETLSVLSALYFFGGFALKKNESRASWRVMLEASGLTLGGIVALVAAFTQKEYIGWFVAVIGALFIIQMYSRKQNLFEIGAQVVFLIAGALVLNDFHIIEISYIVMALSLVILSLDMLFTLTFKGARPLGIFVKSLGGLFVFAASMIFLTDDNALRALIGFAIYTVFFLIYTAVQRKAAYGYLPSAYLPLTIIFTLSYFKQDAWLPALTVLAVIYFILGIAIRSEEAWSFMLRNSALALGTFVSLGALFALKETGGWYIAVVALIASAEMYIRKNDFFEIGAQMLFPAALYLILRDFKLDDYVYILLGFSLIWLGLDLIFSRTFKAPRPLQRIVQLAGGLATLTASIALASENNSAQAAIGFVIYTVFFAIYTAVQRKAVYGYLPAAYLPLTIFFALNHFNVDAWLPVLTALAVIYFIIGAVILSQTSWSHMLRNSALTLGALVSLSALFALKETGGWYALAVGLLFAAEMYLSRNGWFEIGVPVMFNIGAYLILRDFKIDELAYHLLAYSLVWLITDLLAQLTFTNPRPLKWIVRGIGAMLTLINYVILFNADSKIAAIGFGVYALLFLITSLIYRQPNLIYAFTLTLPLCATFLFRALDLTKWIHPVIVLAIIYYAIGYLFRASKRATGWDAPLLFSGLGLGVVVSFAAPILGGIDAALPVALAATLWAVEAFARRNVWLGFPANGLYLLAYFIILNELNVSQPQYFSIGAAMLGMIQHYLLTRIESKKGAFLMGMVSQLILLGTTYIQMVNTQQLGYFFVLFFESLAVIAYGVVIRSRSLTFVPIGIVALGLIAVLYSALKDISAVILVGCSGVLLLMLGILAVMMREKITKISEKLSDWEA